MFLSKSLVIVLLNCMLGVSLGREWCYETTRYYTQSLKIPQRICRTIGTPPRTRLIGLQSKPIFTPKKTVTMLTNSTVTAKKMMGLFPGLFLNTTTAKILDEDIKKGVIKGIIPPRGLRPSIEGGVKPTQNHDGDLHCPTFRNLEQAPESMANVRNEQRDIVHFSSEGVYQYVHKGKCGSSTTQSCGGGSCLQERSIVYLMVWSDNVDWPTGFEAFEVESYCSCKGVTP